MMKKSTLFLFFLTLLLLKATAAHAQRSPLYIPGFAGGMNAAVQPYPGVYLTEMVNSYFAQGIKDQNGNTILNNLDLDITLWFNGLTWVSPFKVLKAHYGTNLFIPFANPIIDFGSVVGREANNFGLSDIYFEPLYLGWNFPRVSTSFSYGIYAPTGRFHPASINNLGKGTWTHQLNLGATVFFDKKRTFSFTNYIRPEIHQQTRDTTLTLGPDICWEWAIGKTFAQQFDFAVEGYGQWQIGDNTGTTAFFPNSRTKIYGAGAEFGVAIPLIKSRFAFRLYQQFGGELRTQGTQIFISLSSALWNNKPPTPEAH